MYFLTPIPKTAKTAKTAKTETIKVSTSSRNNQLGEMGYFVFKEEKKIWLEVNINVSTSSRFWWERTKSSDKNRNENASGEDMRNVTT